MVKLIKNIVKDVLYVSKLTKTRNKKILTLVSVVLSQLSAYTDIAIIAIFSALIVGQYTGIHFINLFLDFVLKNKILIVLLVILRFVFQYLQKTIIYRIELNVNKNLKIHILGEIFDKRNYSVADSYFYINILSMHISYFYSSFATFLNSLLQILAYSIYLIFSDVDTVGTFGVAILILILPTKKIIDKAREFMHESYEKGQESNQEVQRVVENLFLIKILKKDEHEINEFSKTVDSYVYNLFSNFKYGVINSFLPSFFTLFVLSLVLAFTSFAKKITLDFIGVTLRLFQSLGNLTTAINQIVNSHVHIEKFYEMEKNKIQQNKQNFLIQNKDEIGVKGLSFRYFNSEDFIFEDINFMLGKNTHTVITGPNGSGKSTLLGLLAGVLYANDGKVLSFSEKFGYIGATPLIFDSSLYENVMYGNENKVDEKEIVKYLKLLETFKEEKNYSLEKIINNKNLSSGQMQKIAFVRALIADTEILLLDEATANLDQKSKEIIFQLLSEKDITIINSTHDPKSFKNVDKHLTIEIINEKRKITLN
tara:strand:- start:117 stop:1730 length:1614 start_codon:yes stop_codon:yes gene_type:complete